MDVQEQEQQRPESQQDELENDSFAIKDMETSEQVTVPMARIVDELLG